MGKTIMTIVAATAAILLLQGAVFAEEKVSREQIKGLDEQIQEIKSDVLSIATELNKLEEKLLYPSHTEVSIFVSLAEGEKFRLDSIDIKLDATPVAHHIYTFKELEALRKGGVQNIYTGNIRTGDHEMEVQLRGKSDGGSDFQLAANFTIHKDVGPNITEINLARQAITFKDK